MTTIFLRRRKLGKTSCESIANFMQTPAMVVRNDQPFPQLDGQNPLVIRWGTTSNLPTQNVLNKADAIHRVSDKAGFRKILVDYHANGGLLLCPKTFFHYDAISLADYPLVVRPKVHAQGKHVYLVNNAQELVSAINKCGQGWYASAYINKVAEYRVAFVQGRVAWVAKKTPGNPDAVAWNVAQGGRFDNVLWGSWPLKAVKVARMAFLLSGLDFGGVDVMVDANDNAFVLEINSAPSQTSPYRQECMAKCFDYIVSHGKNTIGVSSQIGGWKKFIHPALSQEAWM